MGRWLLAMAAMLAALGSFGASAASAQRTRHHNSARAAVRCEGTRFQEEINANVIAGPGCILFEMNVHGDVSVEPGGSLNLVASNIFGNVKSNKATSVLFNSGAGGSTPNVIEGDVRLVGTTEEVGMGCVPPAGCAGANIFGNLQITNGSLTQGNLFKICEVGGRGGGGCLEGIGKVQVGGDFKITNNTGSTTESEYNIVKVHVGGDFKVTNNELTAVGELPFAGHLGIFSNEVLGNLDLTNNTAPRIGVAFNTVGVCGEDLLAVHPVGDHAHDRRDRDPQTPDARDTAPGIGVAFNTVGNLDLTNNNNLAVERNTVEGTSRCVNNEPEVTC
jgi:hypothetical protein